MKVFVGISGGVDSSVSALLLKEKGYDVTGVFIRAWYPDFLDCNWRNEMRDAMRVCAQLEIPFLVCDAEHEYKTHVIDYLINEYSRGRTPNPDVMCNKQIKFKTFLNFARKNGADFIATGHYARNVEANLLTAADSDKDQTYFLWNLNKKILCQTIFPIGHLLKSEVRRIAKKNNLFTASKKDSQGLCFLGHVDMKNFLRNYLNPQPGDVLDDVGKIIGRHEGAILYTIGERHDFEIYNKDSNAAALFVTKKDVKDNTITVSSKKKSSNNDIIEIQNVNFIKDAPSEGQTLAARIRYRQPLQDCIITKMTHCTAEIRFKIKQNSITPGQSLVLYDEKRNKCLGGGIIA